PFVPRSAVGCAGIGRDRDEITEIAGVAHRRVYALVGQDAGDDQGAYAEVAQHVVDIGRDEHRGRGLRDHDLVLCRADLVQYPGVPGAFWDIDAADLIVEAAVAS